MDAPLGTCRTRLYIPTCDLFRTVSNVGMNIITRLRFPKDVHVIMGIFVFLDTYNDSPNTITYGFRGSQKSQATTRVPISSCGGRIIFFHCVRYQQRNTGCVLCLCVFFLALLAWFFVASISHHIVTKKPAHKYSDTAKPKDLSLSLHASLSDMKSNPIQLS